MNLDVLIHRYGQQLEILNRSPHTWRTAQTYLRQLQRFLAETKIADVQAVTSATLADFQRWLFHEPTWKGTMRSVASQNRVLSGVSGFFAFLREEGILARNPAENLTLAREPETLPRNVLTPQEARKIIERPDVHTVLGYRDRTILETLYATGVRKSELMNLTLADVNLEEELLRVNGGKGAKDRVSPLTKVACTFLGNYITGIRPVLLAGKMSDGGPACNALFISLRGGPICKNALGALVEKYAKLAGVKKHVTCHLWRHSCATHLVKNQANLRHVQEILGHRSLATTERYLHLTITDLKEAHRKHHPREIGGRAQALASR